MNEEALRLHQLGKEEKDTFLRNQAFNGVVDQLLRHPSDTSAYYMLMGDTLVELRQYPLALYYELNALKKKPSNNAIRAHIEEIIKLGNLNAKLPSENAFGPSNLQIGITLITLFLFLSIWLASKKKYIKNAALVIAGGAFIALLYEIIFLFRSPIFAVVIQGTQLFQAPETTSSAVSNSPMPAGIIVTVLKIEHEGSWIKIRTPDGIMGFVSEKSIRLLE